MRDQIRTLAQQLPDHLIAAHLNATGLRTLTGKTWTTQRVGSVRIQHAIPTACPVDPTAMAGRGDGLIPVRVAAERLDVSPSLVHVWVQQGVLVADQSRPGSYVWVRLTEADLVRLTGSAPPEVIRTLPSAREILRERQWTYPQLWGAVRAGAYLAYHVRHGQQWEWRFQASSA